jgi:hypothetical protein
MIDRSTPTTKTRCARRKTTTMTTTWPTSTISVDVFFVLASFSSFTSHARAETDDHKWNVLRRFERTKRNNRRLFICSDCTFVFVLVCIISSFFLTLLLFLGARRISVSMSLIRHLRAWTIVRKRQQQKMTRCRIVLRVSFLLNKSYSAGATLHRQVGSDRC